MRSRLLATGLLLWAGLAVAPSMKADTIYRINPQGKQEIFQRDAIVVQQDSSILVYKHFDLKQRRVEKVQLIRGSLPYVVVTSNPRDRRRIVELWKRFGYTATVTDASGKTTRVFDAYIDFFPPAGQGSFTESVPAVTSFILQLDGGAVDNAEFSQLSDAQIQNGVIRVHFLDGHTEQGKFLIPTAQPAEVRFLGITNAYNPSSRDVFDFSRLLLHLKDIHFDQ